MSGSQPSATYGESNAYFRCGGCQQFVLLSRMQEHYEGDKDHKPHELGLASAPMPGQASVANPPLPPMYAGMPIPPVVRAGQSPGLGFDILLMKRTFPKAFWTVLAVSFAVGMMAASTLYTYLVFHI